MIRSNTYIATPPGSTIKEQLEDRGMTQKEFAARLDMSEKHISKLINGEVILTAEMAVKLEMVLGIPASFWTNLESIYREKLIKIQQENDMETDKQIAKQFPYNEMVKLNWVEEAKSIEEKVINLRKFFEIVKLTLLTNNKLTRIACRRLNETTKSDYALIAWAQKAKLEARNHTVKKINLALLEKEIPKIRSMTIQSPDEFCNKLTQILSNCGIALIFLPHLKGSFLHGATFYDGNKIVIGLTVRGKDADKFWFSLFHEIGHILKGHINQLEGTSQQDEKEADEFASNILIPLDEFKSFILEKNYTKSNIIKFANKSGIDAGILVGRLQKEHYVNFDTFNDLKKKYKMVNI